MSGTTPPAPPAGWYADAERPDQLRWWDGSAWGPLAPKPPTVAPRTVAHGVTEATRTFISEPAPQSGTEDPSYFVPPRAYRPRKAKKADSAWIWLLGGILVPFLMGAHRMYLSRVGSGIAMLLLWLLGVFLVGTGAPAPLSIVGVLSLIAVFVWWVTDAVRLRTLVDEA